MGFFSHYVVLKESKYHTLVLVPGSCSSLLVLRALLLAGTRNLALMVFVLVPGSCNSVLRKIVYGTSKMLQDHAHQLNSRCHEHIPPTVHPSYLRMLTFR